MDNEAKQKKREANRKWREANKEKVKELGRKWREENKEKLAEKQRLYRKENKELVQASKKSYKERTKEARREINKQIAKRCREKNKEKISNYTKKYDNQPTRKFTIYERNARTRNLVFEISFDFAVCKFNEDCHYCGRTATPGDLNGIDRKDNFLGYIENNCIACCGVCNRMKNDMGYLEFVNRIKSIYCNFNKV